MKELLSWILVLLGVAFIVLAGYQVNQYFVQQATIQPSLAQLEKMDTASLGVSLEETRALLSASSNALVTSIVFDAILGLVLLAGGIFLYPSKHGK